MRALVTLAAAAMLMGCGDDLTYTEQMAAAGEDLDRGRVLADICATAADWEESGSELSPALIASSIPNGLAYEAEAVMRAEPSAEEQPFGMFSYLPTMADLHLDPQPDKVSFGADQVVGQARDIMRYC